MQIPQDTYLPFPITYLFLIMVNKTTASVQNIYLTEVFKRPELESTGLVGGYCNRKYDASTDVGRRVNEEIRKASQVLGNQVLIINV